MRKGIVDVAVYNGSEKELIVGQIAILGGAINHPFSSYFSSSGASIWLLIATAINIPVATTHSLVGATLGFSLLQRGTAGIQWNSLVNIGQFLPYSAAYVPVRISMIPFFSDILVPFPGNLRDTCSHLLSPR